MNDAVERLFEEEITRRQQQPTIMAKELARAVAVRLHDFDSTGLEEIAARVLRALYSPAENDAAAI